MRWRMQKWRVLKSEILGLTETDGTITIDPRVHGKLELETLLHEIGHLAHPDMSEAQVDKEGKLYADIVWAYGYRYHKPCKKRRGK